MLQTFKPRFDFFGNEIPYRHQQPKISPPHEFIVDLVAPSLKAVLDYLSRYQNWIAQENRDPQSKPEIDTTPQPGQVPARFTAQISLPDKDLRDILINCYNSIAARMREQAADGVIGPLGMTVDNGHWGKFSVIPEPQKKSSELSHRERLEFQWTANQTIESKEALIIALRAIANDAETAANWPDTNPDFNGNKNYNRFLNERLAAGPENGLRFYCDFKTNIGTFHQDLLTIVECLEHKMSEGIISDGPMAAQRGVWKLIAPV